MQALKNRSEFPELGTLTDVPAKDRLEEAYARFQKSIDSAAQPKFMFSSTTPTSAISMIQIKIRENEKQPENTADWKFLEACRKKIGEKSITEDEVKLLRNKVLEYYPGKGQDQVMPFLNGDKVASDFSDVIEKAAKYPKVAAIIERMLDETNYGGTELKDNWENFAPGHVPMPQYVIANPISWIMGNLPSSKWEKSLLDLETRLKKASASGLLDISESYMKKK